MKAIKFNDFTKNYRENKKELSHVFNRVLESGQYILGKEVINFEKEFAKYLGARYAVGVGNGLEALQISLMALNIQKGDEVITTPISAAATTLAILAVGAKPIFVDVTNKGLIDPNLIPNRITKKTKAILPVHLYGQPVDLDKIKNIAKKYHLDLIEDACQAHGSFYKGKKIGVVGNVACFSFYPTKNLGTFGDGGAIVTNNQKIAGMCSQIRNYGQKSKYNHIRFGLNSRLDELHAAILAFKLKFLDEKNQKRRSLAKKYIEGLSDINSIEIVTDMYKESNFHLFVIRCKKRNQLQKFLHQNGIPTDVHYPKILPEQNSLKRITNEEKLERANKFIQEILSLPCHPQMTINQVNFVCSKIKEFIYYE